ncbi:MAG: MBL fold metallo-hydrolase [Rhodocyclaceae bacterium]|jgi:glyoxylase-like metal-dependent hydrolase (beta-lactamase superfamily II)|nr:MBL fold metallo-hydrolase [Rhodocyclaceae bacterium]
MVEEVIFAKVTTMTIPESMNRRTTAMAEHAIEIAPRVHWIGALDPDLRSFDIILKTANGTTYNSYVVRGSTGVAVIDTVKESFAATFFRRLESVTGYDEIRAIVLNHLEPDHSGALPELLRRAPQAQLFISSRGVQMLKGLLHGDTLRYQPRQTGTRYAGAPDSEPSRAGRLSRTRRPTARHLTGRIEKRNIDMAELA